MHPGITLDDISGQGVLSDEFIYGSTTILLAKYKTSVDIQHERVPSLIRSLRKMWQTPCGESDLLSVNEEFIGIMENNEEWFSEGVQLVEDDKLLSQILLSCDLDMMRTIIEEAAVRADQFQPNADQNRFYAFEDEVTKALMTIPKAENLDVWVVFAVQLLLDIRLLKADIVDPYKELRCKAAAIDKALGVKWSGRPEDCGTPTARLTTEEQLLKDWGEQQSATPAVLLSFMINSVIGRSTVVRFKEAYEVNNPLDRSTSNDIYRPRDPAFV
jgi:hypothetical protein